jgi:hypothetical protein
MSPAPGVPLRRREFVLPTVVELLPRRTDPVEPAHDIPPAPPAQRGPRLLNRPLSTRRLAR